MNKRASLEDAFQQVLDGGSDASDQVIVLAKLASALQPVATAGPRPEFRSALRAQLIAHAGQAEDAFAAAVALPVDRAPAEVRSLVAVAAALAPISLPTPSAAFRFQLRNRLIAEAARPTALSGRVRERVAAINGRMQRSLRFVAATGLAAALVGGSGAAMAAANHALPGDTLYGLKRVHESTSLLVASGADKGFRILGHARTRLHEVRGLTERGTTTQALYTDTLGDMDTETVDGTTLVLRAVRTKSQPVAILARVTSFTAVQVAELSVLVDLVPEAARGAARDSLNLAERINTQVTHVLQGCTPCSAATPGVPAEAGTSGSANPAVTCGCGTTTASSGTDANSGGSSSDGTGTVDHGDDNRPPKTTPPPSDSNAIDVPPLPGNADQPVEDTLDTLIDTLGVPIPTATATAPPLPVATPSVTVPAVPGVTLP